ncbi:MAG: hypothetical protein JOY85_15965 [Acidobacteriaceae bacterium]|nr:hypothetical protein [Acidobacteriaceae bacterium]
MPTSTLPRQTPLETLVISQLMEIRKRESALRDQWGRFSSLGVGTNQTTFTEEMLQLQQCTDRLSRMMDAMSGYSNRVI